MSNEPPSISPDAVIVVAPEIAPLIVKYEPPVIELPATIVVPTSNAVPTKAFFLITAPPCALKDTE